MSVLEIERKWVAKWVAPGNVPLMEIFKSVEILKIKMAIERIVK